MGLEWVRYVSSIASIIIPIAMLIFYLGKISKELSHHACLLKDHLSLHQGIEDRLRRIEVTLAAIMERTKLPPPLMKNNTKGDC